jgi:hypothetical protein
VTAHLVRCRGIYCLWTVPGVGYVHVTETTGVLHATRADLGSESALLLRSPLITEGRDLTVAFNGRPPARLSTPDPSSRSGPAGRVLAQHAALVEGQVRASVVARRNCVVVLSASYDPGWSATVDGRPVATQMIAPALVGVPVGPGVHAIVFRYDGFGSYDELWALSVLVLLGLGLGPLAWRKVRRRGAGKTTGTSSMPPVA